MIRTLFIIAGAGLVLAAVCFGGAAALGGRDLARHGWTWTINDRDGDKIRFERVAGPRGPDVTRTLAWTGGDTLGVDLAADVRFVQGAETGVTITGPKDAIDRIRLTDGRLSMVEGEESVTLNWDGNGLHAWSDGDAVQIVVTAPNVTRFDMRGSSRLEIENYNQPTLAVDLSGSGAVEAAGVARAIDIDIAGSGSADLEDVRASDATVDISGSGEATVAATGQVAVDISGSGNVTLAARPANLNSTISGSGEVHQD